jgi:universal stress protein E
MAVTDPTRAAQPALALAADHARRTGAPLVLVTVAYAAHLAGPDRYPGIDLGRERADLLGRELARLRGLAKPLGASGLAVTCRAVFDRPLHEAIVREVLRHAPALVVKDTHHHPALARLVLTNTDWHLIRECPAPLWLVKSPAAAGRQAIVAAVDPLHAHDKPADLDRAIIGHAQALGVALGAPVELVHACDVAAVAAVGLAGVGSVPAALPPALVDRLQADHARALDELAAGIGLPAERIHFEAADPATALPAAATRLGARTVVMGAVARGRLRRAFVGSTAERVLDALDCDVLVVKPADFACPVSGRQRDPDYVARTARLRARAA